MRLNSCHHKNIKRTSNSTWYHETSKGGRVQLLPISPAPKHFTSSSLRLLRLDLSRASRPNMVSVPSSCSLRHRLTEVVVALVHFQFFNLPLLHVILSRELQHGQRASNDAQTALHNGPQHNLPSVVQILVIGTVHICVHGSHHRSDRGTFETSLLSAIASR